MAGIIDPYVYRERLTMPKLVIDAGGDEFFMLDDNHFWWDDMVGELHLLMVQVGFVDAVCPVDQCNHRTLSTVR